MIVSYGVHFSTLKNGQGDKLETKSHYRFQRRLQYFQRNVTIDTDGIAARNILLDI